MSRGREVDGRSGRVEEVHEGFAGRVDILRHDLDVEVCALAAPVLPHAPLDEAALVERLALREQIQAEKGARPHVAGVLRAELLRLIPPHAKHQHVVVLVELLVIEHGHGGLPVGEGKQLGLREPLLLHHVLVLVHLLHYRVSYRLAARLPQLQQR